MVDMNAYTDVMVDIETTSTTPDRGAILQIAAVKFNLKEGTVSDNMFDRSLIMPAHRHWDEGTRKWWGEQKEGVLNQILFRAEDWRKVMADFLEWAAPAGHLRFWSKPSHFDFMFVSSYFKDADLPNPFSYRDATDMNSFLRGKYFPNKLPELFIEFDGDEHNALNDTLYQLKVLFAHVHPQEVIDAEFEDVDSPKVGV